MRLLFGFAFAIASSNLFAASPAPVANTKIKNAAETNTLDIDSLSRASVKIQGGSDNTTIGNTGDRLKIEGIIIASNVVDSTNSTATPLAASATFTGATFDALTYASVSVSAFSSSAGTLQFQFSNDGTNFDTTKSFMVDPGLGTRVTADVSARYYRVRFINSATAQTALRLQTILHPFHRSSTEEKEQFEPENARGRTYISQNIAQASATSTIYTVTPGRTLHVTGGMISMVNTSLPSLGTGRLDIRDGSTTVRIPLVVPGGTVPIFVPFTLPTGMRFTTNVTATIVFGSITYSVFFTGYEADE